MVLPFYVQLSARLSFNHFTSSMVAGVSLTLSGLVNAFLYMILRANAARMAIKPIQTPWQSKRNFRLFGPSDLECCENISSPLGLIDPKNSDLEAAYREKELDLDFDASQRLDTARYDSGEINALANELNKGWPLLVSQQGVPPTPPPKGSSHRQNGSYSLFPTAASADIRPISTHSENEAPNTLLPPRPFFSRRHKRDSSAGSSATVQIGLRLSLAPSTAFSRVHGLAHALASPKSPRSPKSPKSPRSPRSLTPRSPASPAHASPLSRQVSQESTSTLAPLPSSFFTRPKRTTSLQQPPPHIVTQIKAEDAMPAEPTPVLLTSRRYLDNVRSNGNASTPSINEVLQPEAPNGLRQNPPTPSSAVRPAKQRSPVWSPLLSPLRSPKSPLRALSSKTNGNWI